MRASIGRLGRVARTALTAPKSKGSRFSSLRILSHRTVNLCTRAFSTSPPESNFDSHDDFKPQSKQDFDMSDIHSLIEKDVKENPLMIYMKGTPNSPRCGFSKTVVDILRHMGYDFRARDVLSNELLRQGIKDFSDWPTVPQVYVDGEFVGGCDIMIEMFKNGELEELLSSSAAAKLETNESST
eukprot:jgi/Bigna1/46305/estExt_Genewise1.C_30272